MTPPAGRVVAAITGAGSGIGRALAIELAWRGTDLALSDLDAGGLATTRTEAEAAGASVHTSVVDVADRAAVAAWARDVVGHFGVVHQLYNNAGIAFRGGRVLDSDYDAIEQTLQINLWGVIHGTKEFLVVLTPRRGAAQIARSRAASGTKYGVVMTRSSRAAKIVATNMSDIASSSVVGPVPNICAIAPPSNVCGAGCAVGSPSSDDSPVSAIQEARKMYCSCRTTGPSQRSQMSIHGAYLGATLNCGSAQFWEPQ